MVAAGSGEYNSLLARLAIFRVLDEVREQRRCVCI